MLKYTTIKPRVYIEPTVVSHLVARPSNDAILASWQRASRQLWENYADRFEFVISSVVRAEIQRGDPTAAQQRLAVVSPLTVLEISPEMDNLVEKLLDSGQCHEMRGPMHSISPSQQDTVLITWCHGTINIL